MYGIGKFLKCLNLLCAMQHNQFKVILKKCQDIFCAPQQKGRGRSILLFYRQYKVVPLVVKVWFKAALVAQLPIITKLNLNI